LSAKIKLLLAFIMLNWGWNAYVVTEPNYTITLAFCHGC